jgi:cellulose synthase/poly-beta-1,6-N-acetylglucosamine synthase-like glycosyltransferase/peptidoglycan/xylan/chitin deacetylase (PgdA/CDA1 family)
MVRSRLHWRARRPPGHRLFVLGCVVALVLVLLANGLSTQTTGRASTNNPTAQAPLKDSPALLTARQGELHSPEPPPGKRIALTFDDGPDPRWTPRIAGTLLRLHATATFFELGSQVVRHPDLSRRLHAAGFEIGNHTFSHPDLSAIPDWQRRLQLSLTDTVLAGAVGIRPRLVRPPYSANTDSVTPRQDHQLAKVAGNHYVIALSELDGRDWARPGVAAVVRNATPRHGRGGIVLLHDGGGDRSETAAALERLIPRLRRSGYRFVTVSQLLGVPRSAVELPAGRWEQLRGEALIVALTAARWIARALTSLLVLIGVLTLARLLLSVVLARRHTVAARARRGASSFTPPVSIVVPAFNERTDIEHSVGSLAGVDYPDFEVIVVDDGSADGTAEAVERMELPRVKVLRQANQGKPAALNRGLEVAQHDLIVMVDADTVFERDTLRRLVAPLDDPEVGAVSGNTKVANRRGLLGRWQHIEYVMGFNLDRRLYEVLRCMPTVPGAIGAFRRSALDQIGGVSGATLAEDTDITIAIGRDGWNVVFADDACAWTDAPPTLGNLWRQRYRWAYGTLQAVWKHRAAMWRHGEGRIGRRALPLLLLFQILLPLLAPLVDIFALYGLLFLNPLTVVAYWLAFTLIQMVIAVYAFRLDGESLRPLWALPLQQFVYRQLMYLVLIESVISALRGLRIGWQRVRRTGEFDLAPSA